MKLVQKVISRLNVTNTRTRICKAIDAGDWPLVLRFRRRQTEYFPRSASAWLQYGHALKECGFYDLADDAYLKARDLKPGSGEISLQRGHLQKLRGNIGAAFALYSAALEGWQGDAAPVQVEIDHLRGLAAALVSRGVFPDRDELDCAVYISSVCKVFEESDRTDMSHRIGRSDYSYAFALKGFARALDDLGIDYQILNEVAGIANIRNISTAKKIIHIGFYPPEKINLLKGAYNIICFAWEFERLRLPEENLSYNAFSDQASMLALADELWIPSQYGVESVKRSVRNIVTYMPSPAVIDRNVGWRPKPQTRRAISTAAASLRNVSWVPLSIMPRIQDIMSHDAQRHAASLQKILFNHADSSANPIIYVALFNAYDYRKNIDSLIRGFDAFSREYPNAYLFLKVADEQKLDNGPNASVLHGQMSSPDSLVPSVSSRNIWLTRETLTREQLNTLFDVSRFYVCPAIAEGQNLPLIEAMARRSVPVSVRHTAMNDYIQEDNAVIMTHRTIPAPIGFAERYQMFGITLYKAGIEDVYDALVRSVAIPEDGYEKMATAAFDTVQTAFGTHRLSERLDQLLS